MSKKTRRMKRAAEEKINRKDAAIRQHNEELENLKEQYEGLDICDEDKKVIDNYIACKDARAERMAEKLYEKGCEETHPHQKADPQMCGSGGNRWSCTG